MATHNRPAFFRQALRYFERQTYPSRELIVIDDGDIPVGDLCAANPMVRYVRLEQRTENGTKFNIGVEHARGPIIQKLDDDDYYSPEFLATSVSALPVGDRDCTLVVRDCFLVWFAGEHRLRFSGHGWTAGGTFCFGRELWDRIPFRDVSGDADSCFLIDHEPRIVPVCAPEQYWLVRHGRNTWTMMSDGDTADAFLHSQDFYDTAIEEMVSAEDCAFYHSLQFLI